MQTQTKTNNSVICTPPYNLPEGWKWVRLGEVAKDFVNGGTPNTNIPEYWDGNTPWITSADVTKFWVSKGRKYITEDGLKNSATHLVHKDTVLIVTRTGVGKVAIAANDICFSQDITGIICGKEIHPEYLAKFILLQANNLTIIQRGATIKGLTRSDLENLDIPLAPLLEQKRIASKLQELMQEVERARNACEKQLEAAKALLSAYLREVFESEEVKKWGRKKLGEVCEINYGTRITRNQAEKGNYPVYGGGGITFYHSMFNRENEIVISRFGMSEECVRFVEGKFFLNDSGFTIELKDKHEGNMFLYFALKYLEKEIYNCGRGPAQKNINMTCFKNILISFPPLSDQRRIASYLKEKMEQVEKLQSAIQKQLEAINGLPQAYLRKAFRGEL